MRDWHRIFAVSLADTVTGWPFRVIQELELAQIKQRLDAAIIRAEGTPGQTDRPDLPDGLTDLAEHNIVTYKSIRESLGRSAMWELVSNTVLYAKQEWRRSWAKAIRRTGRLRLIAVATQRPNWLSSSHAILAPGVWEVDFLGLALRVIVPRNVEFIPRNSLWHLLSGDPQRVEYGLQHYQMRDASLYNILNELKRNYSLEGIEMPYTIEDYKREVARELLVEMSPEEVLEYVNHRKLLEKMSAEEVLEYVNHRKLLEKMSAEEVLEYVNQRKLLEGMSARDRLDGLSPDEIEEYLRQLRSKRSSESDQ
jgi:hypothetical protein